MNKLSQDQINQIIDQYRNTALDKQDLAKIFGVNRSSVTYWLKKNKIQSKPRITDKYSKHPFNLSFFTKESAELAYLTGFALGDGCLTINSDRNIYSLSFQVNKKDRYILEQFCNWTSKSPDAIGESKNLCQLRFNSQKLFKENSLAKWGIVPNKTYQAVRPEIPKHLLNYFVIGLIDADGSIAWSDKKQANTDNSNRLNLTCNKTIVDWYIDTIKELGYEGKLVHINPANKPWARANITRKDNILSLAALLQVKECDFKMKRKWDKLPL